jgi:hypothetical protein
MHAGNAPKAGVRDLPACSSAWLLTHSAPKTRPSISPLDSPRCRVKGLELPACLFVAEGVRVCSMCRVRVRKFWARTVQCQRCFVPVMQRALAFIRLHLYEPWGEAIGGGREGGYGYGLFNGLLDGYEVGGGVTGRLPTRPGDAGRQDCLNGGVVLLERFCCSFNLFL